MNKNQQILNEIFLRNKVKGKYKFDYNLSKYSWFGIGGNAEIFYIPSSLEELQLVLTAKEEDIDVTVIGLGSNIIIRDGGIPGLVIRLGNGFSNIYHDKNIVFAGAAVQDKVLSKYCLKNSIIGFEFYSGIPGTVGGAVCMNAGCFGSETKDVFIKAKCLSNQGEIIELNYSEELFSYRKNNFLDKYIVCEVQYNKEIGDPAIINQRMIEISDQRRDSQPQKVMTAGSTFKNPFGHSGSKAWQLIDKAGLRDYKLNGVSFSRKHANFIVNKQKDSANLIEDFGENIKQQVNSRLGVELEWEIRILGNR